MNSIKKIPQVLFRRYAKENGLCYQKTISGNPSDAVAEIDRLAKDNLLIEKLSKVTIYAQTIVRHVSWEEKYSLDLKNSTCIEYGEFFIIHFDQRYNDMHSFDDVSVIYMK